MQYKIKIDSKLLATMYITQQPGGEWIASILYHLEYESKIKHFVGTDENEAYNEACKWFNEVIDKTAKVDTLV